MDCVAHRNETTAETEANAMAFWWIHCASLMRVNLEAERSLRLPNAAINLKTNDVREKSRTLAKCDWHVRRGCWLNAGCRLRYFWQLWIPSKCVRCARACRKLNYSKSDSRFIALQSISGRVIDHMSTTGATTEHLQFHSNHAVPVGAVHCWPEKNKTIITYLDRLDDGGRMPHAERKRRAHAGCTSAVCVSIHSWKELRPCHKYHQILCSFSYLILLATMELACSYRTTHNHTIHFNKLLYICVFVAQLKGWLDSCVFVCVWRRQRSMLPKHTFNYKKFLYTNKTNSTVTRSVGRSFVLSVQLTRTLRNSHIRALCHSVASHIPFRLHCACCC